MHKCFAEAGYPRTVIYFREMASKRFVTEVKFSGRNEVDGSNLVPIEVYEKALSLVGPLPQPKGLESDDPWREAESCPQ